MNESSSEGRAVSSINVTPLIDVLLVLLIIFMVIVPIAPRGLSSQIPEPSKNDVPTVSEPVVLEIQSDRRGELSYLINQIPLPKREIRQRLVSIFASRQQKVMFVKGDADLDYGRVAEVIDMGTQAGVDNIGLITPRIEAGQ